MDTKLLKQKSIEGIKWIFLTAVIVRLLKFFTKIVLARLLAPSDFGLVAIGILVNDCLSLFRDMGFGEALIFKKDDSNSLYSNTMFITLPIIALILYVIIYFSSSFIATFFNEEILSMIIKVMSISLLIESFGTVHSILFEKNLDFKRKMYSDTLPKFFYTAVSIYLALKGMGVWSLVIAYVTSSIFMVIIILKMSDWKPTWQFNVSAAYELISYGKHIFISGLIIYIIGNIGNIVAGKIVGVEHLGYYTIALTISSLPSSQVTYLVGKITFPLYSKLQSDLNSLKVIYLDIMKYTSIVSFPIAFGIYSLSTEIVLAILGTKWMESIVAIQILCFFGLLDSISSNCISVFKSIGKPQIIWRINILKLVFISLIIVPLTNQYGIEGTALSVTLPTLFFSFLMVQKTSKILSIPYLSVYRQYLSSFFCSILMFLCIDVIKGFTYISPTWRLIELVFVGMLIYIVSLFLIEPSLINKLRKLHTSII